MDRRIILAAGHGGGDSGAVSRGTTEAAQCIDIVNRVADKLRADGQIQVVVVPHELGLTQTINWVNGTFRSLNSGLLIEVHKNSGGGRGTETWYIGGDAESQRKARVIQGDAERLTGLPNRGVKPDTSNRHGRLGVLRDTTPWALLVEVGFIDMDHFDNDKYATWLLRAILAQWGLLPKTSQQVAVPAPKPEPKPVDWNYRVTGTDGKQLGVYKVKNYAWNKYLSVKGAAKITAKGGEDLTPEFVAEFRPKGKPAAEPVADEQDKQFEETIKKPGFLDWLKKRLGL